MQGKSAGSCIGGFCVARSFLLNILLIRRPGPLFLFKETFTGDIRRGILLPFFLCFFSQSLKKPLIFCNVHFPGNGSFPVHSPTLSSLMSLHLLRFWNIFVGETWLIDFNEFPSAVSFHLEIEHGKYRSWVWTTGYTPIYAIYWNP